MQVFLSRLLSHHCLDHAYLSKSNYASEISGVLPWYDQIPINDAKRCFSAPLYSVYLMSAFGTVKIELAIVVHIADPDSVWIIIVTRKGKHTGRASA